MLTAVLVLCNSLPNCQTAQVIISNRTQVNVFDSHAAKVIIGDCTKMTMSRPNSKLNYNLVDSHASPVIGVIKDEVMKKVNKREIVTVISLCFINFEVI